MITKSNIAIYINILFCVLIIMDANHARAQEDDARVVLKRTGAFCADDPNCFNRLHPAIPMVAHARSGQVIVYETRESADRSVLPPEETPERPEVSLVSRVHALTGPVHIDGARRGDVLAVTILKVTPFGTGRTLIAPIGLVADHFPGSPFIVIWDLTAEAATSPDLPGIRIPHAAFPGIVTVLPGVAEVTAYRDRERALGEAGGIAPPPLPANALPADLCGPEGSHKQECLRTIPPREHGGNMDISYHQAGTTIYITCQIDGCGLAVGDVHFAQGDGEVSGTAIEMASTVTLRVEVRRDLNGTVTWPQYEGPAANLAIPSRRYFATTGAPVKEAGAVPPHLAYLDSPKVAALENLSRDMTLAARNALLDMLDYLVRTRGLSRQQALIVASVAVDMRIAQFVDGSNVGATAILPLDIFVE